MHILALLVALGGSLLLTVGMATVAGGDAPRPRAAQTPTDRDRWDQFVVEQMDRVDIPGVAYAVVGPDGVEHQATFGVDGDGEPVTAATPFLWGSLAKPVTATLVMKMVEAGELALDERVTTYLPGFTMADGEGDAITLRHLLNQTSGIPEEMSLTDQGDPDRRPRDVVEELAGLELAAAVGDEHLYSSLNYVLLGAVVEEVTGRDYADVLRERVLEPAGMDAAVIEPEDAAERLPAGHRYVLGEPWAFDTDFDPAGLSSGYLGGSLRDAVAFARANLSGSEVLTDRQRAPLHAPEVATGDDRYYGLGWRTWPVFGADQPMVWHAGAAPGFQAGVVLLPEQERAVVVLQNVYGSFQEAQLLDTTWGLASLFTGTEPELHGAEPLYVIILSALGLVWVPLVGALIGSLRGAVRPAATASVRRALAGLAGWLAGLVLLGGGLLALPAAFGVGADQVVLWAPDIAVLIWGGLGLAVLLAAGRVVVAVRRCRARAAATVPGPSGGGMAVH